MTLNARADGVQPDVGARPGDVARRASRCKRGSTGCAPQGLTRVDPPEPRRPHAEAPPGARRGARARRGRARGRHAAPAPRPADAGRAALAVRSPPRLRLARSGARRAPHALGARRAVGRGAGPPAGAEGDAVDPPPRPGRGGRPRRPRDGRAFPTGAARDAQGRRGLRRRRHRATPTSSSTSSTESRSTDGCSSASPSSRRRPRGGRGLWTGSDHRAPRHGRRRRHRLRPVARHGRRGPPPLPRAHVRGRRPARPSPAAAGPPSPAGTRSCTWRPPTCPARSRPGRSLRAGGLARVGAPRGRGARHLDEWWGHEVDLDFSFHRRDDVLAAIGSAGFEDVEWYLRGPVSPTEAHHPPLRARPPSLSGVRPTPRGSPASGSTRPERAGFRARATASGDRVALRVHVTQRPEPAGASAIDGTAFDRARPDVVAAHHDEIRVDDTEDVPDRDRSQPLLVGDVDAASALHDHPAARRRPAAAGCRRRRTAGHDHRGR